MTTAYIYISMFCLFLKSNRQSFYASKVCIFITITLYIRECTLMSTQEGEGGDLQKLTKVNKGEDWGFPKVDINYGNSVAKVDKR